MEVENPRIGNGGGEDGEIKRSNGGGGGLGRLCGWPSSRIVRVSRASGGKDRHSKVWTSKGLRDRRVRLSVNTAVQFYDLQDRLGYDQPSKAVEWLLKAAAPFIEELPSLNALFPDTLQLSDERKPNGEPAAAQQHSSPSDTSKGSAPSAGLSLSRSESRILARERARERAAEKEKCKDDIAPAAPEPLNLISQNASFTELLTNGGNNCKDESNFFSLDYVTTGLLTQPSVRSTAQPSSPDFPAHVHLGNPLHLPPPPPPPPAPVSSPLFTIPGEHHSELQNFSFVTDHRHQHGNHNEYNLNFSISSPSSHSGLTGFRGTLQSNSPSSPSLLPHLQRFPAVDLTPASFFTAAAPTAPVDNHHHFLGFDARLQLFYGDHHADHNGKGKT